MPIVHLALTLLLAVPATLTQSPEERAAARDLLAKRADTVVVVMATIKTRMNIGGRETTRDQPVQANATVLDPGGLAVMALSMLEPAEIANRAMGDGSMATETSDLRMRLAGGQEVPAKVVLRDADLDLVFIRPVDAPDEPIPAVDGPAGVPAPLDLLIALQRTGESTAWRTLATFTYVQMTVDRPRTYHALSGQLALGAPVFDTRGRFAGIVVRVGGSRQSPQPALLPAEDIREIAKQAR